MNNNNVMMKKLIKPAIGLLLTGFFMISNFNLAHATSVAENPTPVEDTRTIAEWSSFSGTQIFTMLLLIMIVLIIALVVLSDVIKNLLKSDKFKDAMKNKYTKTILLLIGFSFFALPSQAATTSPEADSFIQLSDTFFWAMVSINVVLLLVVLYMLNFMKWILREINPVVDKERLKETWWSKIMSKMTDAVPVENEDVVMTDHEYDGIRELDNNLPPWWLYGFYVTIVFAFIYLLHFHVFNTGDLQAAEYEKEMERGDAAVEAYLKNQSDNVDEFTATLLTDKASIAEGRKVYEEKQCQQCHGQNAEGTIGPNLTDDYWLHGGDVKDVFKTIKYGVSGKTMQSWKDQITPKQMHQLASYIKSLRGSKPVNGKAPEGDLFTEGKSDDSGNKSVEENIPANDSLSVVSDTLK